MRVLWLYGSKKFKPRVKSELRKQHYTLTLLDCNHLAQGIVLWQITNIMCYCTVFNLFYFVLRAISKYKPRGAYIRVRRFNEGVYLRNWGIIFGGAYTWRGVFSEFYVNIPFICNMLTVTALIEMGFQCYLPYLVSVRTIFAFLGL